MKIWQDYPLTYREEQVRTLARWIDAGQSGSVIGLPGSGRSNLLGFIYHRPEALQTYVPPLSERVALILVNLHSLPAPDVATFYRLLLRAFYLTCSGLDQALQAETAQRYQEHAGSADPFLSQSAVYELLALFQAREVRVVLILNYFHNFLQDATPKMVNTLRGLRDSFKDVLCVVAGLDREVAHLPDPTLLGEMYELLDRNVCWVGRMNEADAVNLVARATRATPAPPDEATLDRMLALSGNFPALLKLIIYWWERTDPLPPPANWREILLSEHNLQRRLSKMWRGLTPNEQFLISEIPVIRGRDDAAQFFAQHRAALKHLAEKGVCRKSGQAWEVVGELFSAYAAEQGATARSRIWKNPEEDLIYHGFTPLTDIPPLQNRLLRYFLAEPRKLHKKDELIDHLWPEGRMADNDLQQLVYRLRKTIADTSPYRYVVTDSGGYRFYPEGHPE